MPTSPQYYDGTRLLSMKDVNGDIPEIFLCTTNRTGGKTTWFNRLEVRRFLNKGQKFMLVYRFNYELDNIAEKFFKDIRGLFFPEWFMLEKNCSKGLYKELYITDNPDTKGELCGYAVALNNADALKRFSHLFNDVGSMLFDEFQSETNHYVPNEVSKFISLHTSVARGNGQQTRYVPVYMLSNAVTLINPYYAILGISNRLSDSTRFLKGDGWVLEQGFIDTASEAQKNSAFNRAFAASNYVAYASQNVYLNDNTAFIERVQGRGRYLVTLLYKNKQYGMREFSNEGIIYVDDKPDPNFPDKMAVTVQDHQINYVMLKRASIFMEQMRYFFERGCFRFKSLECREAVMTALSY